MYIKLIKFKLKYNIYVCEACKHNTSYCIMQRVPFVALVVIDMRNI